MKPFFFRITIICLLSLCLISQAIAAGKGKGKTTKKKTASVETQFDDGVDKLPAKFFGNNPIVVYSALLKNYDKYQKSEFETNDTFQERLRKLDETPLTGKLKYNSTVAFYPRDAVESSYDADKQTMTVTITMTTVHDSGLYVAIRDVNAIEVFTMLSATKKYTGSNAFGVKRKITGNLYDTYAVAVKNDNNLMKYGGSVTLNIPMSPDKAREAKATGNIILVGNLLHPYVGYGTNHISATIDSPTETLDRIQYTAMELTGIWYYSLRTGDVYHKEKIQLQNR